MMTKIRPKSARYDNNGEEVFLFEEELDVTVSGPVGPPEERWFCIVRVNHEHEEWMERIVDGYALMLSERITNACIEGDASDMQNLANAIKARSHFAARRCAANTVGERVELWSPRNSLYRCSVPLAVADRLAQTINEAIANE